MGVGAVVGADVRHGWCNEGMVCGVEGVGGRVAAAVPNKTQAARHFDMPQLASP